MALRFTFGPAAEALPTRNEALFHIFVTRPHRISPHTLQRASLSGPLGSGLLYTLANASMPESLTIVRGDVRLRSRQQPASDSHLNLVSNVSWSHLLQIQGGAHVREESGGGDEPPANSMQGKP